MFIFNIIKDSFRWTALHFGTCSLLPHAKFSFLRKRSCLCYYCLLIQIHFLPIYPQGFCVHADKPDSPLNCSLIWSHSPRLPAEEKSSMICQCALQPQPSQKILFWLHLIAKAFKVRFPAETVVCVCTTKYLCVQISWKSYIYHINLDINPLFIL